MPYNIGDILLDKYCIEEQIGKGAFGEVYRVTHLKLNAPRALKFLRRDAPGLGSTEYGEYQDRFKLEAQLGAKLNHPNIIQVHDFEMDGEDLLLVMEYAAGGNLGKRIEQAKQAGNLMPLGTALAIAQEVAEGLAKLHEMDVVHRDLKPSNILFDEKGHARVADFGLAQTPGGPSMRSQLSNPAPHPGTPAYMSPEQKNSRDYLTPASDVYALGSVLFEMLTGRVYRSQRPGTRVASMREDIPAWLDDLLAAMLSETPESRPWDGREAFAKLHAGSQVEDEKQKAERIQREADERARQAALDKAAQVESDRKQREAGQRAVEIARLSEAAQAAIQRGDWNRAKQSVEDLAKFGKDGQAESARLQERLAQAQREQDEKIRREKEQRSTKIARLTQDTESALARKDWGSAKGMIRLLQGFGPEGQAAADRLQSSLPSIWARIPGWMKVSAVGGLVVFLGFVFLVLVNIGGIRFSPTNPGNTGVAYTPTSNPSSYVVSSVPQDLVSVCKAEGMLTLIATPPDWANYGEIFVLFETTTGVKINSLDPNAGSADELAAIEANKGNMGPQAPDIVDVGYAYGKTGKDAGLYQPYKVLNWDMIPDTILGLPAKDPDGYWIGGYYGGMAIISNNAVVKNPPANWADLLKPEYKGQVALAGDPRSSNQASQSVFAAALANGGSLDNAQPGLDFFKQLNDAGSFVPVIAKPGTIAQGATPIVLTWDYLAFGYRDSFAGNPAVTVSYPSPTIASMYVQAISAYAPHPNCARVWMEIIHSDQGQLAWMKGYVHGVHQANMEARGAIPVELKATLPATNAFASAVAPTPDQLNAAKALIAAGWMTTVGVEISTPIP